MPLPPITSGLKLLLDPNTLGLSDGTVLSSFPDSSGAGNNVSTFQGSPTFKTNIFGTKPAIRFGASSTDALAGTFASWSGNTGVTAIFAGTNFVSAVTDGGYVSAAASGANDFDAGGIGIFDRSGIYSYFGSFYYWSKSPSLPVALGYSVDASHFATSINGGLGFFNDSISAAVSSITKYAIGDRILSGALDNAHGVKFDMGMVAIYNVKLSDSDLNSVTLWMAEQLGIVPSGGGGGGGGLLVYPSMMGGGE